MRLLSKFRLTLVPLLSLMAALAWTGVARAAEIPADKRLPKDVLLYFSCPSIPNMTTAFKKTGMWELVNDSEMKAFRDHAVEKLNNALKEAKDNIEFPVDELPALFAGEFTFALIKPFGEQLSGLSMIEVGSKRELLDKLINKIDESSDDFSRTQTEIQGQAVTVCTIDSATAMYFVKDGMLVIASSASLVEDVLSRWDGKHEQTFASNPVYQEIIKKCRSQQPSEASYAFYVNPVQLVSTALSMSPDTAFAGAMVNGYLPALGLDTFKAIGGVAEVNVGEFESVSRTMFYNEPPARGVPKVFTLRETLTAPPSWVPEEAGQYMGVDWDIAEAYASIRGMYETFLGPGSFDPMIDGLQKQPGAPDLHLKKDVIDALTGVLHFYAIPSDDVDAPEDMSGVVSIGVRSDSQGQKILAAIMKIVPEGKAKTSTVNGITVYVPTDDDQPGAVAVANKQILLAASVDELKEAISGKVEDPLVDSDAFKAARRAAPSKMSMIVYQDLSTQLEAAYSAAKRGDFNALTEGELDFSLLPSFEVVSKYLQPVIGYGISDEHGFIQGQQQLKRKR